MNGGEVLPGGTVTASGGIVQIDEISIVPLFLTWKASTQWIAVLENNPLGKRVDI